MNDSKAVYLDHNATTPVAGEVLEAMRPWLEAGFGNPSNSHGYGAAAHAAVERARAQVAELIGCAPDEVLFTSGGTESNNLALKGLVADEPRRWHLVVSAVEHPAVSEVCRWLERRGARLSVLPVDASGRVVAGALEAWLDAGPAGTASLMSVMLANNEVGTLQPVAELAQRARARGTLVHTDAAQAVGKIAVRVEALCVDLLSLAGHKLYAPKGVGALYVRRGVELAPLLHGAGHERGLRPGTENVAGIVGLGAACALAARDVVAESERVRRLRDRLHDGVVQALGAQAVRLNGHPLERLPNTLSLAFHGTEAGRLLAALRDKVAASAGAACHGDDVRMSATLAAMAVPPEWARGTVRLSLGRGTTAADVEVAVAAIAEAAARLTRAPA
jgi:cysteine desulfurase